MFRNRLANSRRSGSSNSLNQKSASSLVNNKSRPQSRSGAARGTFKDNIWHCDCGLPAECFTVKKSGPNHGRRFYLCQKKQDEQCGFFLWYEDAQTRMEAAVLSGKTSEPKALRTHDTLADQVKRADSDSDSSRPRKRRKLPWEDARTQLSGQENNASKEHISSDDEFYDLPADSLLDAAEHVEANAGAARGETPKTPSKLSPENLNTSADVSRYGLPTPDTSKASKDDPSKRSLLAGQAHLLDTPSPARFHDVAATSPSTIHGQMDKEDDLHTLINDLLSNARPPINLPSPVQQEIRQLLDRHQAKARGYLRGRDKVRELVKLKDSQIFELQQRVHDLEGQVEGLKCLQEMKRE